MAITFDSWNSGTDDGTPFTLDWSSVDAVRKTLTYRRGEALRQALIERANSVSVNNINFPEIVKKSPIKNDWITYYTTYFNYIINTGEFSNSYYFVNHEDQDGDWSNSSTPPKPWTIDDLSLSIGSSILSPVSYLSAEWVYQQYLLLNKLRWTGSRRVVEWSLEMSYGALGVAPYVQYRFSAPNSSAWSGASWTNDTKIEAEELSLNYRGDAYWMRRRLKPIITYDWNWSSDALVDIEWYALRVNNFTSSERTYDYMNIGESIGANFGPVTTTVTGDWSPDDTDNEPDETSWLTWPWSDYSEYPDGGVYGVIKLDIEDGYLIFK